MEKATLHRKHNQHQIEQEIIKNKKIKLNDNRPFVLNLKIFHADGIDKTNLYPSVVNRDYRMIVWVRPGEEKYTKTVKGLLDPVWEEEKIIFLGDDSYEYPFLNVEVLRFNFVNDPGTSSGTVVVGRAMIPLPEKLNQKKRGHFGLVRPDHEGGGNKDEGQIALSMELKRCEYIIE